jgi:hypothetical protein
MSVNRWLASLVLVAFICAAPSCTGEGDLRDTWESRSPVVTVRVQKFDEWFFGSAPTSSLFSFDVQDKRSHKWRPVLKWGVDGDLPIQREQLKFVTDSIVYAFGGAKYVVTTDGGDTWFEWNGMKALPAPTSLAIVQKASVSKDGAGNMVVWRNTGTSTGLLELGTTDFGVHWTLEKVLPAER